MKRTRQLTLPRRSPKLFYSNQICIYVSLFRGPISLVPCPRIGTTRLFIETETS
jgi:hypothetical protein